MRGLAEAQQALAFLYATGQGVNLDEAMAAAWFRRAAEQGLAAAQHNLAVMYTEGRGVEQNARLALHWYYRAACSGSDIARQWLALTREQWREHLSADL